MSECVNRLFLTKQEIHRIKLAVKINRIKSTHKEPFDAKEFYTCPFKNVRYGTCNIENIKPRYCKMNLQNELTCSQAMHLSFCQPVNARELFFGERVSRTYG